MKLLITYKKSDNGMIVAYSLVTECGIVKYYVHNFAYFDTENAVKYVVDQIIGYDVSVMSDNNKIIKVFKNMNVDNEKAKLVHFKVNNEQVNIIFDKLHAIIKGND